VEEGSCDKRVGTLPDDGRGGGQRAPLQKASYPLGPRLAKDARDAVQLQHSSDRSLRERTVHNTKCRIIQMQRTHL
jgi:hypothetical protein